MVHQWLEKGLPLPITAFLPVKQTLKPKIVTAHFEIGQLLTEIKAETLDQQDVRKTEKILVEKGLVSLIVLRSSPKTEPFGNFLTRFWTYEESPYVKERLSYKLKIGRTHTNLSLTRTKRYWISYFQGKTIGPLPMNNTP